MIPGQAQQFFEAAAAQAGASGFEIERSLRFNSGDSAYLNRTPSTASNRSTWTWSGWVKRSGLGVRQHIFNAGSNATSTDHTYIDFWADDTLNLQSYSSNANIWNLKTTQVFRDPSAWYHIVWVFDTTQSTASNRVKLYINGSQITDFSVTTYPSQNYEGGVNAAAPHAIGKYAADFGPDHFNGYLAEVYFIDGQALAATDFGETDSNNNWNPKEYIFDTPKWVGDWASDTTGTPYSAGTSAANAFDGNSSTQAAPTTSSSMVFTPSSPITGITKVRIRAQYDSGSSADILLNGSSIKSSWSSGENAKKEFTVNNLTSLEWQTDGSNLWMSVRSIEIEVDGVYHYLVLGGVNDFYLKFADNSSDAALGTDSSGIGNTWTVNNLVATVETANTSQTWSSNQTGYFSSNAASAFDGNLGTSAFASSGANANAYVDITAINASKVEVYISAYGSGSAGAYYYCRQTDGTQHTYTITSDGTSLGWITVYDGSQIAINRLGGARNSSGAAGSAQYAWKVDDVLLVNAGTAGFDPSGIDSLIDTPTNYTAGSGNNGGNYATLNALDNNGTGTFSNGNLEALGVWANGSFNIRATIAPTSGKWYWEYTMIQEFGIYGGILLTSFNINTSSAINANGGVCMGGGSLYNGGSVVSSVTQAVTGDVMGFAWDVDNSSLEFFLNNVSQGTVSSIADGHYAPAVTVTPHPSVPGNIAANFGQRAFAYSAPSGFKALCTTNLPTPTIADGSTAFDANLWTGDGTSSRAITGYNFSPDFVWIKIRNDAYGHAIFDIVRGANIRLDSANSNADQSITDGLHSFDSNGFTIGNRNTVGENNKTYVGWAWDGGTSTASNTDGSITSNVRANASAGFSIVSYTGTFAAGTIGHGLNAAPELMLVKNRDTSNDWNVYHVGTDASSPGQYHLRLNSDVARQTGSGKWNNTSPTSSVFSVADSNTTNGSSNDMIAYCFAPVEGFSAFGSYTGNGSDDGPFVFTGFRVAWLLIKNTSTNGEAWTIYDSTRDVDNTAKQRLLPNSSDAESVGSSARFKDLLSNGFKIRGTSGEQNTSGDVYIYAAFAEHPFKTARGR